MLFHSPFFPVLLIHLYFLYLVGSDDLLQSPIFEDRGELNYLQDVQQDLKLLQDKQASTSKAENKGGKRESEKENSNKNLDYIKNVLSKFLSTLKRNKRKTSKDTVTPKKKPGKPKWHKWTDWSTCSVTCGKGRMIRWRHCKEHCDETETEMEEMSCQLPECPRKLFGMIKLN